MGHQQLAHGRRDDLTDGWESVKRSDFVTIAPKLLFRDPVQDGAADPIVVWHPDVVICG